MPAIFNTDYMLLKFSVFRFHLLVFISSALITVAVKRTYEVFKTAEEYIQQQEELDKKKIEEVKLKTAISYGKK